jgi:hypothetical protein
LEFKVNKYYLLALIGYTNNQQQIVIKVKSNSKEEINVMLKAHNKWREILKVTEEYLESG